MAVFLPYSSLSSLSGLFLLSFSSLSPLFLVRFRAYPGAERQQGDRKFNIKRMGRKEMEKWGLTDLRDVCVHISIDNLHIQHWIYAFRQRSQCCNRNEIPRDVVTHFLMIPYTDPIFQVRNGNCPDDVHFRTSRHRQRLRQRSRPDVHHECIVFFCIDSTVHVYHRHTTFPTISQTDIIRGMHRFYFLYRMIDFSPALHVKPCGLFRRIPLPQSFERRGYLVKTELFQ